MLLGVFWSIISAILGWSNFTINWIAPFGDIFLNLLKLIALPLVLFSVIAGVVSIGNPAQLGRMGAKTIGAYLISTIIAVGIGLSLANIFQPGKILGENTRTENRINYELWAKSENITIKDNLCISCLPENKSFVDNLLKKQDTNTAALDIYEKLNSAEQQKSSGPLQALVDIVPENIFTSLSGGPMLQVIFFAIFFGVAILFIPSDKSKAIVNLIDSLNEVFIKMIDFIMRAAPFFVFALMAGIIADMAGNDLSKMFEIFKGLSYYSILTFSGLALMLFVVYPLALRIFVNKWGYVEFFRKMAPAQALAFSTSSSAATLPITLDCVENNLKVDKSVSGFVLPIGATINMDGTSLYQALAVIFLAQIHMIDLSLGQQLTIVTTATLASIGSAAVPSAGLVMLMIVLSSVGLNPAWIALILPVDRILDMCRTVVNVTGDATVSSLIAKSEGKLNFTKT